MKIKLICVSILKKSPELEIIHGYLKRFEWEVQIKEVDVKKRLTGKSLKAEESKLLLAEIPPGSYSIALDERGKQFSSTAFADKIESLQIQGFSSLAFLIGGADGHTEETRTYANLVLSLSDFTWPHMLIRVMLIEQLYRAQQIIKGHPYHRD